MAHHPSNLIFSAATNEIRTALGELKRSNLTIKNRLYSIQKDADFVLQIHKRFDLPVIANERCGSWYVPPHLKVSSAYFKSTDGHHGQWSFSLRRLNLQVLDVVAEHGGCIIVDSTRRGKSMPDALSKTVPIWCAVLNRLLFPNHFMAFHTPAEIVGRSEHSQIEELIPAFVESVLALNLDLSSLRSKLHNKPLRVYWMSPQTPLPSFPYQSHKDINTHGESSSESASAIVLCMASDRSFTTTESNNYVQGAADDAENWALGLDANTFWKHKARLLSTSEDDLPNVIAGILSTNKSDVSTCHMSFPVCVEPTTSIYLSSNASALQHGGGFDCVIMCTRNDSEQPQKKLGVRYLHLQCGSGKVASRQLRIHLPRLFSQLQAFQSLTPSSKILCCCSDGRDLAVGIALALLCKCCDSSGSFQPGRLEDSAFRTRMNKSIIKQRLSWIMVSAPESMPSRATLQSVNAVLMA